MTSLVAERLSLPSPRLPSPTVGTRGRTLGAAFAIHVLVAALLLVAPVTSSVRLVAPVVRTETGIRMVYLIQPGPGGGGGGGGLRDRRPPPRASAPGHDSITLQPAPRPTTMEAPSTRAEEPPPVAVSVPLQALAAGAQPLVGLPDALASAVPSNGGGDGGGVGSGSGTGSGEGTGSGLGPGIGGGTGGGVYRPGGGATEPVLLREVRPAYTADALRRKVSGTVALEAIVRADGRADQIRVLRSLDPDLDVQAVIAVRQWLFAPGRVGNRPVDVYVTIELSFTIR